MTVIAAIYNSETKQAVMGADRRTSTETIVTSMAQPKIKRFTDLVFGSAGACRPCELIDPIFEAYREDEDGKFLLWLRTVAGPKARSILTEAGWYWHPGKKGSKDDYDFEYLFATREGLFSMERSLESHQILEPYYAVGSGQELAMGALYALLDYDIPYKEKVRLSLKAAAKHDPGCGKPFDVLAI